MSREQESGSEDKALGIGAPITRRDFVNNSLIGAGGALLTAAAPVSLLSCIRNHPSGLSKDPWYGYGAIGDYATSSGNTRKVMDAAHQIRDGVYKDQAIDATDTGELFDMVVVGGGMSGLGAAHFFNKHAGSRQRCLILENHNVYGGEAKRNEFMVNGELLIAPQGSNDFGVPRKGSGSFSDQLFDELGIPRDFEFRQWQADEPELRFALDNYANMPGIAETQVDVGYFFDNDSTGESRWIRNIWNDDLERAPFPEHIRRELLRWRYSQAEDSPTFRAMLDSMTYQEYLEDVLGLPRQVTEFIEPVIGLINGASPDAVSAFAASQIGMPGVSRGRGRDASLPLSFPGGNAAFARYFVKDLVPESIQGSVSFADILTRRIRFEALDGNENRIAIRLGATVVRIEHDGSPERASYVLVTYNQGGELYQVRARGVVLASGAWVNRHIIRDLPDEIRDALAHFHHSPALIANVALTNWRFMYNLGITAAEWHGGGFGFCCNIRRPMVVGDYRPPLHPDRPTVLAFYLGLYTRGLSVHEQGVQGRRKLFSTSFYEYERQIREQMIRQFGSAGFDPERDIAGIILNRWGHARLVQQPGFYYGTNGRRAPREIVEQGFGRIAIGHSELNGHQSWTGGVRQGYRAAEQVIGMVA